MKQALVYDRVNKIGGAEKILEVLHELYPDSPLYTAVFHPEKAKWTKDWDVRPSFLNRFPLARSTHELYPWLTPLAFESFDFNNFDRVISITSAEAKGIISKPNTFHICYCLTPTRYLWTDHKLYLKEFPMLIRPLVSPIFSYVRSWDKIASQRPDAFIAISKTVKKRIETYYKRQASIVYPPVETEIFSASTKKEMNLPQKQFYLVVSRLVPYKRIELAIKACNGLKRKLTIVGTGTKMQNLIRLAGPTIHFVGKLTQAELVMYYQKCRALLFPQEEDFGISAIEAQAAGKPVIAYNKGGAREIILTGKTGIFFSQQKTSSLIKAIQRFETMQFDTQECKKNAQRFDKKRFIKEFSSKVEEQWKSYKKHRQ